MIRLPMQPAIHVGKHGENRLDLPADHRVSKSVGDQHAGHMSRVIYRHLERVALRSTMSWPRPCMYHRQCGVDNQSTAI